MLVSGPVAQYSFGNCSLIRVVGQFGKRIFSASFGLVGHVNQTLPPNITTSLARLIINQYLVAIIPAIP